MINILKKNVFSSKDDNKTYIQEFYSAETDLAIHRLKVNSVIMILLSLYLFYNDYVMLHTDIIKDYRIALFFIHLSIFIISLSYLVILKLFQKLQILNTKLKVFLIYLYIVLSMGVGTAVSLNSIKVSLNIYTYVTIILFLAAYIPLKPIPAISITSSIHVAFIICLSYFEKDINLVILNRINSTVTLIVALVIIITFFNYRKNDFINEKKLIEKEQNLEKLFEINPFPLFLISLNTKKIVKNNKKAKEHYKLDESNIDNIELLDYFVSVEDFERIADAVKAVGYVDEYIVELKNDNRKNWMMCNCELLEYDGELCILAGLIDITKLKLLENDLAMKASIDALTGLTNRRKGMELLTGKFHRKECFTIVFCDINSLKTINDIYGHNEGDKIIFAVADAILKSISNEDMVFRYGGDEFIIILNTIDEKKCMSKLNNINIKLEKYKQSEQKPYNISVSFGMNSFSKDSDVSLDDLIAGADEEMYTNKSEYYKSFLKT